MKTVLKPGELAYLAMLVGASELFGIPDVYFGKTDDEIGRMVGEAAKACVKKGLCTVDFDGNRKPAPEVAPIVDIVSFADSVTEIVLRNTKTKQTRTLFFAKGNARIVLSERNNTLAVCGHAEVQRLKTGLHVLFSEGCMVKGETESFVVSHDELTAVLSGSKPKSGAFRALLRDKGVDGVTTHLIAEAMAGRAGYFSATTLQMAGARNCSAIFYLADSGVVLQMKITPGRDFAFEAVGCEAARQTAGAFIGGEDYA